MDAPSFPCTANESNEGPAVSGLRPPVPPSEQRTPKQIRAELARRTQQLYSLPAAALRVIRLTSGPETDVRQLTAALQSDPALAARVLAVVNSSVYGLREKVLDLHQAIALLGTKPLKLLVLGLSLPKDLLRVDDAQVLSGYWRHALVKAVAAREISCRFYQRRYDDEAFIAGLLQDLGMLAFVQHLGDPYIQLVRLASEQRADLASAERTALGFDRVGLTVDLLKAWGLPDLLVDFVAREEPAVDHAPAARSPATTTVRTILAMAELCARILSGSVECLAQLHAKGQVCCSATPSDLGQLLYDLESRVRPLAAALSINTQDWPEFRELIDAASAALSQAAARANSEVIDEHLLAALARQTHAQCSAPLMPTVTSPAWRDVPMRSNTAAARVGGQQRKHASELAADAQQQTLIDEIAQAAAWCRIRQRPLSLVVIEFTDFQQLLVTRGLRQAREVARLLHAAIERVCDEHCRLLQLNDAFFALVVRDANRQQAINIARQTLDNAAPILEDATGDHQGLSIGVATLPMVLRNFDARELESAARRCLFAARQSGGGMIKSIDVI